MKSCEYSAAVHKSPQQRHKRQLLGGQRRNVFSREVEMANPDRNIVFDKTCGHCAYCGKELENSYQGWQMDHVTPVIQKGKNGIDNRLPACHSCNKKKSGRNLEEWRWRLREQMISNFVSAYQRLEFIFDSGMISEDKYHNLRELIDEAIYSAENLPVAFYFERQGE